MILAGDIGATKSLLALFERSPGGLRRVRAASFPSGEYTSLAELARAFLRAETVPPLEGACFGVPGPVWDGKVETTNLPWTLDERELARTIDVPRAKLINDLQAGAYGLLRLPPEEFEVLQAGEPRAGTMAVIAPGTGLGEAILYWDGVRYHAIASEGGHTDFAPRTRREIALLEYLQARFGGHVSYERVLSGDGLHNLYSFVRDTEGQPEPAWLQEELARADRNAAITRLAVSGRSAPCAAALELFCSILGAEAANLALKCFAVGGLLVGGGIAPKILPLLKQGGVVAAFADKGRFSPWMRSIPLRVALDTEAPLLGAAYFLLGDSGGS